MPYILNIVVVLKGFQQQTHLLDVILVGKGRVCGGNLLCLCGNNLVALLAEFLSNGCYSGRISCYLNNAVLKAEIVAACFENRKSTQPVAPMFPPNLSK